MHDWEEISSLVADVVASGFKKITLSKPLDKNGAEFFKIVATPRRSGDAVFYQFEQYFDTRVKHENVYDAGECAEKITALLQKGYGQADLLGVENSYKLLFNKKHCKIIKQGGTSADSISAHNNDKKYLVGGVLDYLVKLGIMDETGRVFPTMQKKFRQINKFLEIVNDNLGLLPREPEILEVGCGKSYLTFALYNFLVANGYTPTVTGIDLKTDVVDGCNRLARELDYERLKFITADVIQYSHGKPVDMLVSLHACDVATDYALYAGVKGGASVILAAPCCQHELNAQIKNDELSFILKHGILKEKFSAIMTDAVRALALERSGYKCQLMEFVDPDNTPKNIMIRAVKRQQRADAGITAEIELITDTFKIKPTILKLLE